MMFEVYQPYTLSGPYGKQIKTLTNSWESCVKDKKCVGFTRYGKGNYKLNKKAKLVKVVSLLYIYKQALCLRKVMF